ncbi:hypothetical protein IQ268_20875 [Oculatella sp. LEGE 06141]|uniref:hypothetical protein n=1 Tax=Oculatella sp. LEGE 06141 TaxID=1828648 RepID=UPI001881B236|nr:hypothetical protein [Oculatella sp. LEGE 06141]MBE9181017.1 hypothetical protein [Oculatella sp. LEGE 06141]
MKRSGGDDGCSTATNANPNQHKHRVVEGFVGQSVWYYSSSQSSQPQFRQDGLGCRVWDVVNANGNGVREPLNLRLGIYKQNIPGLRLAASFLALLQAH